MASKMKLNVFSATTGSTVVRQQPQRHSSRTYNWWQLLENAAKSQYGHDIKVLKDGKSQSQLTQFIDNLKFSVIHSDAEPVVARPTIIDVTTKEVVNLGKDEKDKTVIRVGKNLPICSGTRYHFSSNDGVSFDHKDCLGAFIVSLAMTGGYMRLGADWKSGDQAYDLGLKFDYQHEEKVTIPPKMKMNVKITTLTKKFRQDYTLEFTTPRSSYVDIKYLTRCQQKWCCYDSCCSCLKCNLCCCKEKVRRVYASDILRSLPNFKDSGGMCTFTQNGTLTWIGESYNVEKTEEFIQ